MQTFSVFLSFLENMAGWTIKNGGDGWNLEDVMVPHPNQVVKKNFVTSYGWVFTSGSPKNKWPLFLYA